MSEEKQNEDIFSYTRVSLSGWMVINKNDCLRGAYETIRYGCPYLALARNFISSQEILEYILKIPLCDNTLIAYRAVCYFKFPQYVNEKHFLSQCSSPEYGAVYILSNCNWEEKINSSDENNECIKNYLNESAKLLLMNKKFSIRMRGLCGNFETGIRNIEKELTDAEMTEYTTLLIRAREYDIETPTEITTWRIALWTDWIDLFSKCEVENRINQIIYRCQYLETCAPNYWEFIKLDYEVYLAGLIGKKSLHGTKLDDMKRLSQLFSDKLIPPKIIELSDFAYQIYILPKHISGYIIGFPIGNGNISSDLILLALIEISKIGKDLYLEKLRKKAKESLFSFLNPITEICSQINFELCNLTDSLGESIYDYVEFDRLLYFSGDRIYCFTRPEFSFLREKKENFYTKEKLPNEFILEIGKREIIATDYQLPSSCILSEFYSSINEGKFIH
jgi:hypothetical protein